MLERPPRILPVYQGKTAGSRWEEELSQDQRLAGAHLHRSLCTYPRPPPLALLVRGGERGEEELLAPREGPGHHHRTVEPTAIEEQRQSQVSRGRAQASASSPLRRGGLGHVRDSPHLSTVRTGPAGPSSVAHTGGGHRPHVGPRHFQVAESWPGSSLMAGLQDRAVPLQHTALCSLPKL